MCKLPISASGQTNLTRFRRSKVLAEGYAIGRTTPSSPTSPVWYVGGLRGLALASSGAGGTLSCFHSLFNLTEIA